MGLLLWMLVPARGRCSGDFVRAMRCGRAWQGHGVGAELLDRAVREVSGLLRSIDHVGRFWAELEVPRAKCEAPGVPDHVRPEH